MKIDRINNFIEPIEPEVNMGVTLIVGSDRYPGTIIFVNKEKTLIKVVWDIVSYDHKLKDYKFKTNTSPKALEYSYTYTLRKDGRWCIKNVSRRNNTPIILNYREYYQNPSF